VVHWPSKPPDLTIIETVWNKLKDSPKDKILSKLQYFERCKTPFG